MMNAPQGLRAFFRAYCSPTLVRSPKFLPLFAHCMTRRATRLRTLIRLSANPL